ncbi:hypothetical protein LMG31887_46280 (plasmid) [Xanthomonas hydrangeae]|nr:hypothetical protein LMG31887_46280 [Xanthomonas hydrangeae]CAD7747915.1 hypothetical protein LMG31887_46280 [Xanthomonas hydrangeae]CAD7748208.1 hypothetical protein LMG31885_45210 [Xanthomonas hydrangeae]CAD7748209.1 hypothetical protein LMG31885_45210 [Xanthomonas hydrangeae]
MDRKAALLAELRSLQAQELHEAHRVIVSLLGAHAHYMSRQQREDVLRMLRVSGNAPQPQLLSLPPIPATSCVSRL